MQNQLNLVRSTQLNPNHNKFCLKDVRKTTKVMSILMAILNMVVIKNEITYHIKYIIIIANFLGNKLLEL